MPSHVQPHAHAPAPTTADGLRTVAVRLVSAAGTGYFYTFMRARGKDKLALVKYDPKGKLRCESCAHLLQSTNTSFSRSPSRSDG